MTQLSMVLLGVPFANLKTAEFVDAILKLQEKYSKDLNPHFISLADTDSLSRLYSWDCRSILSPELLYILRHVDKLGTNSRPLIWLSRALGTPLKPVSEKDLLLELAGQLNVKKQSVFLLGEGEGSLKEAVSYIRRRFPDIKMVGGSQSPIFIEGEDLENALERDALLLEQINRASPDFLFINLSHPKQEIWFHRVRNQIDVPVSIGITERFENLDSKIWRST